MAPPVTLVAGTRSTVTDGFVPHWSSLRFVDESGVPDLESFVHVVDALPAFHGDVKVSHATLRCTFVPEPSSLVLMLGGLLAITALRRIKR